MSAPTSRFVLALMLMCCCLEAAAQSSDDVCDPLHPGYFTYVQERRDSTLTSSSLTLYEPFGGEDGAPVTDAEGKSLRAFSGANGVQMPPCLEGSHFVPGRFQIGERSEIVIAFNPRIVKSLSGQIGRIDVSGKIIKANATSQVIEIPGYREIGKATPAIVDQFSRSEKLVADVLLLMRMGDELRRAEMSHYLTQPTLAEGISGGVKVVSNGQGTGSESDTSAGVFWALSNLYPNKDSYMAAFKNILASGDILSRNAQEFTPATANVLRKALTVAQLGKSVLEAQEGSLTEFRDKIARSQAELETTQANLIFRDLRQLLVLIDDTSAKGVSYRQYMYERSCLFQRPYEINSRDWCGDKRLAGACKKMVDSATLICNAARPDKPSPLPGKAGGREKARVDLEAAHEQVKDGLRARADETAQRFAGMDAVGVQMQLQRLFAAWRGLQPQLESDESNPQALLSVVRASPYLGSFVSELREMAASSDEIRIYYKWKVDDFNGAQDAVLKLYRSENVDRQAMSQAEQNLRTAERELQAALSVSNPKLNEFREAVLRELRQNIGSVEMLGFREIRLQPRILDAADGDVIEITIRYIPPGAEVDTATARVADAASETTGSDGRLRTASWTLRFLLEKVGWYVLAGPRLSMNFSDEYTPEAENLRGTWGSLSLGVGADFSYFPGQDASPALRTTLTILSGVGLRVDQLDFDSRQATEFGLEGHVLLFRGLITAGVGVNTAVYPTNGGRALYYSVGLGLEQLLDEALRLAEQSKR